MKSPIAARANTQILEEASAWFIEANEAQLDATAREAFNRWLRTSPEHVRAYLETAAIWENASLIDKARCHGTDELLAMARDSANVIPLDSAIERSGELTIGASKRRSLKLFIPKALAASVVVALCGAITWFVWPDPSIYSTAAGEQRSIVLADGSTVTLNSSSRVRVDFTRQRRNLELLKGQALFNAVRDPARPFTVSSGRTQVVALGTQFDIDRRARGTVITVLEGRVAVSSDDEDDQLSAAATLAAGEQIVVSGERPRAVRADVSVATAWTQRRLVFSSTPLSEVAEEYNRHHARPLMIRDRALNNVRVSGSFSSIDAASLIDFLRDQREIDLRETPAAIEVIRAAANSHSP